MSNRTAAAVALLAALSVAALTGCTAPPPEAVGAPSAEPAAEAAETPAATQPTPSAEPAAASSECKLPHGDGLIENDKPLNLEPYANMADLGPREGANGTTTLAADGTLASYVVAADDYTDAILDRFCVGYYSFSALNAVRRGSVHSIDPSYQAHHTQLYVGDTLNLSPYTITTVGDVNGEVHAYGTVFILPPQH